MGLRGRIGEDGTGLTKRERVAAASRRARPRVPNGGEKHAGLNLGWQRQEDLLDLVRVKVGEGEGGWGGGGKEREGRG